MHYSKRQISLFAILVFVITCYANIATADQLCDTVLKSGAFNTSDYAQTSSFLLRKRDDVCKSDYNSVAEATSAAQQGGASIGYGPFSFGAAEAKQTSSGRYSIADSRFCRASAEDIDSFTSTRAKSQVTDIAVNNWLECVKNTQTNKLFIRYSENTDGTGITGTIIRTIGDDGGAMGRITGISSSDPAQDIACRIGTKNVIVNKEYDLQIEKGKTAFSCKKQANKSLKIALITSQGDPEWILMPSAAEQKQRTIDAVNDAVNALRRQLEATVPKGTVAAFKLDSCPQGWVAYADASGRVIVGAGSGLGLTPRVLHEKNGEEKHTLTISEMPKHRHQLPTFNAQGGPHEVGSGHYGMDWVPEEYSKEEGGDQPHNNMPPYLVLTICTKQ